MKFRYHAGSLADSMDTQFEFSFKQDLINRINNKLAWCGGIKGELNCSFYGYDSRINENTHLISDANGIIGMADCDIDVLEVL